VTPRASTTATPAPRKSPNFSRRGSHASARAIATRWAPSPRGLALVRAIADRVVVLDGGAIVEAGATDDVLERPQAPCTRALLADTPAW